MSIFAVKISDSAVFTMSYHSCVIYAFEINKWFIIINIIILCSVGIQAYRLAPLSSESFIIISVGAS